MPAFTSAVAVQSPTTALINRSQIGQAGGLRAHFGSLALLNAALANERAAIDIPGSGGVGLWVTGDSFTVAGEPAGVFRSFFLGASSALSHCRMVVVRSGMTVVLDSDTNTVSETTGAPSAGVGNNGDLRIDWAANLYYKKAAGSWGSGLTVFPGGGVGGGAWGSITGSIRNQTDLQNSLPDPYAGMTKAQILESPLNVATYFNGYNATTDIDSVKRKTVSYVVPAGAGVLIATGLAPAGGAVATCAVDFALVDGRLVSISPWS